MKEYSQAIHKATLNRVKVHTDKIYNDIFVYKLLSLLGEEINYRYDPSTYIISISCSISLDELKQKISNGLNQLLPDEYKQNDSIKHGLFFNVLQLDTNSFNILL